MENTLREGLVLLKKYCAAFGLKATVEKDLLEPWEAINGPIIAGAFLEDDMPPIVWCDPQGAIWINQDEDLLTPDEPATAIIGPDVLMVAINNSRPIHPRL